MYIYHSGKSTSFTLPIFVEATIYAILLKYVFISLMEFCIHTWFVHGGDTYQTNKFIIR